MLAQHFISCRFLKIITNAKGSYVDSRELLQTKVHTTITKKITTHFLALNISSLQDRSSTREKIKITHQKVPASGR